MSTVAERPTIAEPISIPVRESVAERPPGSSRPPAPVEPAEDRPYPIRADVFLAMIEAEVFPDEARVYLQDGRIYEKMAKTRPHSNHAYWISPKAFSEGRPGDWLIFVEGEFLFDDWNAKLPDLALVRAADERSYLTSAEPMRASDVSLAVEIAVTSLSKDLGVNLERYARAMIPNYWVADVPRHRLFVHTEPRLVDGQGVYAKVDIVVPGGAVDLVLAGQAPVRFAFEDLML